jgi:hypothetical protein
MPHKEPMRSLCLILLLAGALLPTLAEAQLFNVDVAVGYDSTNGDVAYNAQNDEYLIVWETSTGHVRGQIRRSDTSLVLDNLPIFTGSQFTYKTPRATFKSVQNLYVVVAHEIETTGPLPLERIIIKAFDRNGALVWARYLTNGLITVRNPDVVADSFGTPCCILATWEELFGSIKGQQMNADGSLAGSGILVVAGSSEFPPHAMNPSVTYQQQPADDFLVAYQLKLPSSSIVEVRRIEPVSGTIASPVTVATLTENPRTSYGERFSAGLSVTYNESAQRYLIAWGDNGAVRVQRLNSSSAILGSQYSLGASTDTPYAASAQNDPRDVVIVGRKSSSTSYWMQTVQVNVIPERYVTLVSSRTRPVNSGATAFSPVSRRFLYTWQEEELAFAFSFDVRGLALSLL